MPVTPITVAVLRRSIHPVPRTVEAPAEELGGEEMPDLARTVNALVMWLRGESMNAS
jgi:hypothetical protein